MLRVAVAACSPPPSLAGCFGGGGSEPPAPRTAPAAGQGGASAGPTAPATRSTCATTRRRSRSSGSERISFANTGPKPLRSVWLRTWANAYGSCAKPLRRGARHRGRQGGRAAAGCTALEVRLAEPLARRRAGRAHPRRAVSGAARADRFGRMGDIAVFGNGIPLLAVADRTGWHLPPYTDRGESFFSLAAAGT